MFFDFEAFVGGFMFTARSGCSDHLGVALQFGFKHGLMPVAGPVRVHGACGGSCFRPMKVAVPRGV